MEVQNAQKAAQHQGTLVERSSSAIVLFDFFGMEIEGDHDSSGMAEKADCRAKCGWLLGLGREEWDWQHLQNRNNNSKFCKKEAEKTHGHKNS